jgi:hypothetical protein
LTPPSENESGVTLTTPITEGRGNRSSRGITFRCSHELDTDQIRVARNAKHVKNIPEVAQTAEHPAVTRGDAGSNPALGAAFMAYSKPG